MVLIKTLTNEGFEATTNRAYGTIKVLCSFYFQSKGRNDMNYQNFIFNNGKQTDIPLERHHVIPKSVFNSPKNNLVVYLTPQYHGYAHILYDRENGTDTAKLFRNFLGIPKDKINEVTLEDCEPLNAMVNKRNTSISDIQKEKWKDSDNRKERVKRMSDAKKGKVNVCVDTVWMNDGVSNSRIKKCFVDDYLSKGYSMGQIKNR